MSSINLTQRLTDTHSYNAWFNAMKAKAMALNIWHLIDPEDQMEPRSEPRPPVHPSLKTPEPDVYEDLVVEIPGSQEIRRHETPDDHVSLNAWQPINRSQTISADNQSRPAPDLEGRATASNAQQPNFPNVPNNQPPIVTNVRRRRILTAVEQEQLEKKQNMAYKLEKDAYGYAVHAWERELRSINHMIDWFQQTVTSRLYENACLSDKSLRSWAIKLESMVGIDKVGSRKHARSAYKSALKPPSSRKKWLQWLADYETAVLSMERSYCPEIKDWGLVKEDFLDAAESIHSQWAVSWRTSGASSRSSRDASRLREGMVKDFREIMESVSARGYKAAFGATADLAHGDAGTASSQADWDAFHAGRDPSKQIDKPESDKRRRGSSTSRQQRSGPRKPMSSSTEPKEKQLPRKRTRKEVNGDVTKAKCLACGYLNHNIEQCFYLMPKATRPDVWEENPGTAGMINWKRRHDPDFQATLKALESKKDKRRKTIKEQVSDSE
jgi:hypothetical protein